MAHPNKFVSVNLNKSYGKPTNPPTSSASSVRHHSGGGGGGMVVLSRHRGSSSSSILPKSSAPKLSVPAPLNLPSLRKENEKFDHGSSHGSSARPGSSGIGSGPGASVGWTKPAAFLPEKEPAARSAVVDGSAYMPPAARAPPSSSAIEKAVFLKGEDFPSLKAATFIASPNPKQKELKAGEEERAHSPLPMRPQMRSSRLVSNNVADGDSFSLDQSRKQQTQDTYFSGPLPIVKLAHTSDWADDERDTGLSLPDRTRDRDRGFQRPDFDVGNVPFKDFHRGDSFGTNKDGRGLVNSWRGPPRSPPQLGFDRDKFRPKPPSESSEMNSHFPYGESARGGLSDGTQDSRYPRRDLGFSGANFQNGKKLQAEGFLGRGNEQQNMRNGRFGDPSNNRYRGDSFQNNIMPKVPFSAGSKGLSVNDPILNFGRDKRLSSSSGKPYSLDAGFDDTDPFSDDPIGEVNVKVFKRKKEVLKQTDFHDPVRASFEAELERVQRIQEQERQRVMEEQARVMELARREQEERERLLREEEERRQLIEEEAREAAWRAEQERMEAARSAEEQKIAREEEKRRMFMEEERRKENARKKLLELEARMAKRQTDDSITGEERVHVPVKERDVPKVASDVGDWEDGERMVEHITSTTSSDSSNMNRYFETGSSRLQPENTSFMERGKHGNYWKRDTYDNGSSSVFHLQDQESDFYNARPNFSSGRPFTRKENFGGFPSASTRPSSKGGTSEYSSVPDDLRYPRGNRWNGGGDGDHFNRNLDIDATDFYDNEKFGDGGWGSVRSRGSPNAPNAERAFQNEADGGFPSFGRSRHSLRQPRVLPPPSISSMRHIPLRNEANSPGPTSFLDSQSRYHNAVRNEGEVMRSGYDDGYDQRDQAPRTQELLESDVISSEQKEEKNSPRCDSQSSLSVSNPPSSPTHLSHDGFDEADDNPALETLVVEEHTFISHNDHTASEMEVRNTNTMGTSSTVSQEEDDEWAIEKNEMNEQEDYDEEDGYQEEEEAVHDGDGGETLEDVQEFDDPPSVSPNRTGEDVQMVLDCNEVVGSSIGTVGGSEKTSRNNEKGTGVQDDSAGDHSLQDDSAFTEGLVSESSKKIMNETEKALQELTLDPLPAPTSSSPESTEASSTQGASIQQPITSGLSSPMAITSTVQSTTSTVSAVEFQAEAPIRLQFGLFSGPSLIPSPVPAIQIGSIQMPLHLPPPQPPFFQFGQLRYPSPLSQGILPLAPPTMSFVQPLASAQYSPSQNLGGSLHSQGKGPSSQNSAPDKVPSGPPENQPGVVTKSLDLSQGNINYKLHDELSNPLNGEIASRGQTIISFHGEDKARNISGYQNERHIVHDINVRKNYRPMSHNKEPQVYPGHAPSQISTGERTQIGSGATGIISNSRGRRFTYNARNASTRPLFPAPETSRTDSSGFQRRPRRSVRRTEFRVRENVDRREREHLEPYSSVNQEARPNFSGRISGSSARYGVRKDDEPTKLTKKTVESENLNSGVSSTYAASSSGKVDELSGREALSKKRVSSFENLQAGEGSGKKNVSSEEDVGAPLQSGVVCVFRQPGIEAPSDEDDFIEVRSKRQMLNDRREQREKEIKAKSKVIKAPRKHQTVPQSNAVAYNFKKSANSFVGDATNNLRSDAVISDGRDFPSVEASPIFTTNMTSQSLPPIGTPAAKVDSDARFINLKSPSCVPGTSSCAMLVPGLPFEKKNTVLVNASLPSGSWSNSDINQQVMALTQSQLDDAMKPVLFDSNVTSSISLEPTKSSTSIMAQEKKSFPTSASPLNSLLAGERIQFGAVTSPTILPPISRAISNGIAPPGSSRSDVSKDHSITAINNDCTMFFDKQRNPNESCTQLEDPEAEAEAAASAVAVAAITNNDEIVGNRLGACSVPDSKSFTSADNTELTSGGGMTASKEVTSQTVAEESLSVALPADLSVDTPLPLWHPLPSPQSTSGPMLSHFPQPFPIVDVNPIFGGPFFAFGPHDESGGTQSQPPRSTTLGSGPLGPWPHNSGVDSFYGPPTGFAGPYISPPGGIPGVQAPPHMVVYNHFAPVGQFGQVFMGTTYIPTGKQPDWKHNPVSSATGVSEGEITNLNVSSVPRNPPNMPSPLQHLAPGSPLMPMASPLPIFDMSPFQSSADIPFQARWSHLPAPSIHSVPLTMPLQQQQQHQHQQQVEGDLPSQFGRIVPVDVSTTTNRFNHPSTTTDGDRGFSVSYDGANRFPDELSLVQPPIVSTSSLQTVRPSYSPSSANNSKGSNSSKGSSRSVVGNASEAGGSSNGSKIMSSSFKLQASQQQPSTSGAHLIHPIGYGDQRGGGSQNMGSGGEWPRRGGYQGRGHGSGSDKSFGPSKMKQIYVAKPPSSGPASTS